MKNLTLLFIILAFAFSANTSEAQVRVKKGDIKVLKGQKTVGIKFTYDKMAVGKFKKENDYIKKKVAEYNEKEAGRGDTWKEAWLSDRASRFQPKFLDLAAKYTDKAGLQFADDPSGTKYTIIVNTDFTEPGFNVVVMRKNAEIRTTIKIVETETQKVVATMTAAGQGRTFGGNDWDTGVRIAEAYAKTGKEFGKYLSKKALK